MLNTSKREFLWAKQSSHSYTWLIFQCFSCKLPSCLFLFLFCFFVFVFFSICFLFCFFILLCSCFRADHTARALVSRVPSVSIYINAGRVSGEWHEFRVLGYSCVRPRLYYEVGRVGSAEHDWHSNVSKTLYQHGSWCCGRKEAPWPPKSSTRRKICARMGAARGCGFIDWKSARALWQREVITCASAVGA